MYIANTYMKRCSSLLIIRLTQIKNHCEIVPHNRWLLKMTGDSENVKKFAPLYVVGGNVNGTASYDKQYRVFLKICTTATWSRIATAEYIPGEFKLEFWREICTLMFTAALFTGIKMRNQPICPSTDEWLQKMCSMGIMKY